MADLSRVARIAPPAARRPRCASPGAVAAAAIRGPRTGTLSAPVSQAGVVLPVPADRLAVYLVAAVALILTPGPDTVYVLARGASGGRAVGAAAGAGVATGILVHTTLVALGLAALLRASPTAFDLVRLLGAAYLVVLGLRLLRRVVEGGAPGGGRLAEDDGGHDHDAGGSLPRAYGRGVAVNVLNPKVAVFFLAFLPGFAGSGPGTTARLLFLGGLYAALTLAYLGSVGLAAGQVGAVFRRHPRLERGLDGLAGTVLVGLGAGLALEG